MCLQKKNAFHQEMAARQQMHEEDDRMALLLQRLWIRLHLFEDQPHGGILQYPLYIRVGHCSLLHLLRIRVGGNRTLPVPIYRLLNKNNVYPTLKECGCRLKVICGAKYVPGSLDRARVPFGRQRPLWTAL